MIPSVLFGGIEDVQTFNLPKHPANNSEPAPDFIEGIFGPTDINAACGNGRLTAGISKTGTVTVLKWPRPSFYDQLEYKTRSRELPLMGAEISDGVFCGMYFENGRISLFRNADSISQRYYSDESNIVVTRYGFSEPGIQAIQTDFIPPDQDVFIRTIKVETETWVTDKPSGLFAYANFRICTNKFPYAPVSDWLFDRFENDRAFWNAQNQVLIQSRNISPERGNIYSAFGTFDNTDSFQCGIQGTENDALAADISMSLKGNDQAAGDINLAFSVPFDWDKKKSAESSIFVTFAELENSLEQKVGIIRSTGPGKFFDQTVKSDRLIIKSNCMPDTDDSSILRMSKRALLINEVVKDPLTGALGCSVANQPPYTPDWPRDGSYMNLMLDIAGQIEYVTRHNLFYADIQGGIFGNWDMCVYGDGTPAGPLFLELDTIGITVWNLFAHYEYLKGESAGQYLDYVYPSIKASAEFFTIWKDPSTNLPLPAFESDFVMPKSTLLSAGMAYLTLKTALEAGYIIGEAGFTLDRWEERKNELNDAIFEYYYDDERQVFIGDMYTQSYMIYPIAFLPVSDHRIQSTAAAVYEQLEPMISGRTAGGSYVGLAAISLAKAWDNQSEKRPLLFEILDFLVHDIPTPGTGHYGECFVTLDDRFETRTGIPHPMTHSFTYTLAAELFGITCPEDAGDDDDTAGDDDIADDDDTGNDSDLSSDDDHETEGCCG